MLLTIPSAKFPKGCLALAEVVGGQTEDLVAGGNTKALTIVELSMLKGIQKSKDDEEKGQAQELLAELAGDPLMRVEARHLANVRETQQSKLESEDRWPDGYSKILRATKGRLMRLINLANGGRMALNCLLYISRTAWPIAEALLKIIFLLSPGERTAQWGGEGHITRDIEISALVVSSVCGDWWGNFGPLKRIGDAPSFRWFGFFRIESVPESGEPASSFHGHGLFWVSRRGQKLKILETHRQFVDNEVEIVDNHDEDGAYVMIMGLGLKVIKGFDKQFGLNWRVCPKPMEDEACLELWKEKEIERDAFFNERHRDLVKSQEDKLAHRRAQRKAKKDSGEVPKLTFVYDNVSAVASSDEDPLPPATAITPKKHPLCW